jgi:hypothetical protein
VPQKPPAHQLVIHWLSRKHRFSSGAASLKRQWLTFRGALAGARAYFFASNGACIFQNDTRQLRYTSELSKILRLV